MQFTPVENIDETWKLLSSALREIQNHNASKLSYEALYRYSYDMVLYHSKLAGTSPVIRSLTRPSTSQMETGCTRVLHKSLRNTSMPWLNETSCQRFHGQAS